MSCENSTDLLQIRSPIYSSGNEIVAFHAVRGNINGVYVRGRFLPGISGGCGSSVKENQYVTDDPRFTGQVGGRYVYDAGTYVRYKPVKDGKIERWMEEGDLISKLVKVPPLSPMIHAHGRDIDGTVDRFGYRIPLKESDRDYNLQTYNKSFHQYKALFEMLPELNQIRALRDNADYDGVEMLIKDKSMHLLGCFIFIMDGKGILHFSSDIIYDTHYDLFSRGGYYFSDMNNTLPESLKI